MVTEGVEGPELALTKGALVPAIRASAPTLATTTATAVCPHVLAPSTESDSWVGNDYPIPVSQGRCRTVTGSKGVPHPGSRLESVDATPPANLVLAEDEPMIGRILEFKLTAEGHRLTWVRTASEAEALVRAGGVDLLLCDVTLEEDGRDLCRRLIRDGLEPPAGVVLMPELRDPEGRERGLAAGAREVIVKPFKPTAVAATIRGLLEQAAR